MSRVNPILARAAPSGSTIGIVTPGSQAESRAEVLRGISCHGTTLSTLPLGVHATVEADALTLTIDEPALIG